MAYGRLDIFFPDGTFKTFALSAPVTTLGRADSNLIALDSDTISPNHLRIEHRDGQANIAAASTADTFVDGERLATDEARAIFGGEEILIGDLRLVYHFYDDTPTRPIVVPEEVTQRIEAPSLDFAVDVLGPDQAVSPGAHIAAQLTIHNLSTRPERYTIEVTGLPRDWIKLDPTTVDVPAGQMSDAIITFKPARRPESSPGRYRVIVITRPKSNPDAALKAEVALDVLPFSGFGMALEDQHLNVGERFKLYLHNQGSSTLNLTVSARDLEGKLRFNMSGQSVQLTPGQRSVVQGVAAARSMKLFGESHQHKFDLLVRSRDASGFVAAVRGYVTVKPSLPVWTPAAILAGLAAFALMIVVVLGVLVARPLDEPVIRAFSASSTHLTQGQPLTLEWDIDNAERLALLVNDNVIDDQIDPSAGSLEIDTSAYTGAVLLTLRAINASGSNQASQAVEIVAPLAVSYFSVEPPSLVRYVVQTITVNWSVSGAVSTYLGGLDGFTTSPLTSSYGASGTVQIAGIPLTPLEVTLTALDASGTQLQEVFPIEVIDPQCTPDEADVTLYSAPRADSQVVATITLETLVTVDAQDATGQWLRVLLPGGAQGWGARNLLTCEDTFDPGQLRKEIVLPTQPPPTGVLPPPVTVAPVTPTPQTPIPPTATGRLGG